MKRVSILAIIIVFFAISCAQSSHKTIDKTDSVFVLVRYPSGTGYLLDTGILHITSREVLDTQTHKGKWTSDTTLYVKQNVDTLRDPSHKPIFDSLHHPLFRRDWFPIPDTLYQLVHIKHAPFN